MRHSRLMVHHSEHFSAAYLFLTLLSSTFASSSFSKDISYTVRPSDWKRLNATLGGKISAAVPFARSCFPEAGVAVGGHEDQSQCAEVMQDYVQRDVLPDFFGAYLNTAWETCIADGETCLLDEANPQDPLAFMYTVCEQGNVPSYYIDVSEPSDVISAFEFARAASVPLSIKNTGHDYAGRSSGAGTLLLWMHNLQDISVNRAFTPSGCTGSKPQLAASFGSGVTIGSLYTFADDNNITIFGGADTSLALGGGYIMGGGHSAFANVYGLAADQALEFDIVTPDGVHRTANKCQNTDLFFALRGGGGGTFGAVLRVTVKAFPRLTFPTVRAEFSSIPSLELQLEMVRILAEHAVEWALDGWGAYFQPSDGVTLVNPLANMSQAEDVMSPLRDLMSSVNGTFLVAEQTSYLSWYNAFISPFELPSGSPSAMASRLMSKDLFISDVARDRLINAISNVLSANHTLSLIFAVTPFLFADDGMTSVNPAWRSSLWQVMLFDYWSYDTPIRKQTQIFDGLHASAEVLRQASPQSGTYLNEADLFEPNYTDAFWGDNYPRLLSIKQRYDPHGLLDCWHCVGWKGAVDRRYRCYPAA